MKATKLLKAQHKEVASLFEQIEDTDGMSKKHELFETLAAMLVAHDAIERELFYPACEKAMGMDEILGESLVEHGVIEFSLYLADLARGEVSFEHKVKVLREMVEHHVEEEEKELFPKVERAFDSAALERLGVTMEARFEQAIQASFRAPLYDNLSQVLAGATKAGVTTPKPIAKNGAKSKKTKPAPRAHY